MLLIKLTTAFAFLCLCQSEFCDYYWRDYNGVIPEDAVEGGRHQNIPFYVGQAYFKESELLPATIYHPYTGKTPIATAYNKVMEAKANVKILCSCAKENFKWIPKADKDLHLMNGTHFVIGGSEVGQQLYIGRVFRYNEAVLGKVFQQSHQYRGIWVPTKSGSDENFQSFEVLTFTCENKTANRCSVDAPAPTYYLVTGQQCRNNILTETQKHVCSEC